MSLTWSLQALLVRHEAYVAEAEKEKERMSAEIERLNADKLELEARNAAIIEENRNLLEQLEGANTSVLESETYTQSLTETLNSTQHELHRLSTLSVKTERLEKELEDYEIEQADLQTSLEHRTEGEKAAVLRWQSAERKLVSMEDHLERLEQEAREERVRHVEMVARVERQRIAEKELETATGRLCGGAITRTTSRDKHSSAIVSHFVKDVLQDNATLQLSLVELREMLAQSNEEIERLREHLAQNLPADESQDDGHSTHLENLGQEMSRRNTQEVHVHHHYHTPSVDSSRRHSQMLRRPRKKRHGLTSGTATPSSAMRTPRSSIYGSTAILTPASEHANLSLNTSSAFTRGNNRWSMQSAQTFDSSIASSPQSHVAPSLFDRNYSESGMDSSRPTTPDSEDLGSPYFVPMRCKRGSIGSFRAFPPPTFRDCRSDDPAAFETSEDSAFETSSIHDAELTANAHDAIPEEDEQDVIDSYMPPTNNNAGKRTSFIDDTEVNSITHNPWQRPVRRAASHESILSVSGLDTQILKARPSQLLVRQSIASNGGRSLSAFSSQPVVSATVAHAARPSMTSRTPSDKSRNLLSGMASDQRAAAAAPARPTLGSKVGGWMFGRWGATTVPVVTVSTPLDNIKGQKQRVDTIKKSMPTMARPPGINQLGPISGFAPKSRAPISAPVLTTLDEEGLMESLSEL